MKRFVCAICVRRIISAAAAASVLLSTAGVVQAQDAYFNTALGDYNTAVNWSTGSVPTSSSPTNVYIGGSGGYTATLAGAAGADYLYLGANTTGYNGPGTLDMNPGASLTVAGAFYVGAENTGTVTISSGTLSTLSSTIVGSAQPSYPNVQGTINVTGGTSVWSSSNSSYYLYLGYNGPGYLNVTSGGTVTTASYSYIGGNPGNIYENGGGAVAVDGPGSTFNGPGLFLGVNGSGSLSISNGASSTMSENLYVGEYAGAGTLGIFNGGSMTAGGIDIGSYEAAGTATVDGRTSELTFTGAAGMGLQVNEAGYGGTLNITNGATVNANGGTTALCDTWLAANATLNFGASHGGTLNSTGLFGSPSQVTGAGTINAHGLVSDVNLVFNSQASLTQSIPFGSSTLNLSPSPVNAYVNSAGEFERLGAGYFGSGSLVISNGTAVTCATAWLGFNSGSFGTGVVTGAGSQWNIDGTVSDNDGFSLYYGWLAIAAGGSVNTTKNFVVSRGGTMSIDVGNGSALSVGSTGGSSLIISLGTVRVVCGADPAAGNSYTPILLNGSAWTGGTTYGGTVQAIGGTWNNGTGQFTASSVVTGTSRTPINMDTSLEQRAAVADAAGNTLGASFLAAASSNPISPTVTALGGSAAPALKFNQFLFGDWGLSGVTASSDNPVYLSLSAAGEAFNTTLWCYNGDGWSQITGAGGASGAGFLNAPDLTFDGTDYSFTLTGSDGTGLGFNGYDYAVVGTPALAGDVNLDGRVDVNDLTIVLSHFGAPWGCVWSQGCIDGDPIGRVDVNDLTIVLSDFGATVGASAGLGIGAVPEPGAMALLAAGAVGLLACAWRWRK